MRGCAIIHARVLSISTARVLSTANNPTMPIISPIHRMASQISSPDATPGCAPSTAPSIVTVKHTLAAKEHTQRLNPRLLQRSSPRTGECRRECGMPPSIAHRGADAGSGTSLFSNAARHCSRMLLDGTLHSPREQHSFIAHRLSVRVDDARVRSSRMWLPTRHAWAIYCLPSIYIHTLYIAFDSSLAVKAGAMRLCETCLLLTRTQRGIACRSRNELSSTTTTTLLYVSI